MKKVETKCKNQRKNPLFTKKSGIFNQKNKEKSRKKIVGKIINQMIA